jgi:hypothetical protein
MAEFAASMKSVAVQPLAALVPMAHVADVPDSIAWYEKLGFVAQHTWTPEGRPMQWAYLSNGGAQLMLVRSARPMNAGAQDVLFYLYAQGVAAYREKLISLGLQPGELTFPPYAKNGEFRIDDPDGYCLLVGDTEQR